MKAVVVSAVIFLVLNGVWTKSLKSHGESCTKRKDCNQQQELTCLKGICKCPSDQTVYSETLKTCVIKIGRRCNENVGDGNISINSTAGNERGRRRSVRSSESLQCIPNAECKKLRVRQWCRCLDGFMEKEDGMECAPVVKYGEFCDSKSKCDERSGMECLDGNCQCPFAEHQYFDQQTFKCVSFAGGNCSIPFSSPCVKHAQCTSVEVRSGFTSDTGVKKIHTKSITQCLCQEGFSKTKNTICMASSGTTCNSEQPCNDDDHLACVDGKCKCRNPLHQTINEDGKCVNLVGTPCRVNHGPKCVENSDCIENKCECRQGFSSTPQKTCLLGYKEICEPNMCNKFSGLACIKSFCECFDSFLTYDNETKACVGLSSSVQ